MSTVLQITKSNGCSPQVILQMNNNFVHKIYHDKQTVRTERTDKWITLTLHSQLVRKVTNLFEQTNLQIAFKTDNTLFDMLKPKTIMHYKYLCRGIYKLTWQTCAKPYLGQMESRLKISFDVRVQQRYIRTHNVKSAYAVHILNKGHECGSVHETMKLTEYREKGGSLNCWKNFCIFSSTEWD